MYNYKVTDFDVEITNSVYSDVDQHYSLTSTLNTCFTGIYVNKLKKFTGHINLYVCHFQENVNKSSLQSAISHVNLDLNQMIHSCPKNDLFTSEHYIINGRV